MPPQQQSAQTLSSSSSPSVQQHKELPSRKRRTSVISQDSNANAELPQDKRIRDLLTDEERRANHIASEQKRRNTIRTGFKELTDIIPTLKNINNSKSTILFKAVEYVRHLEKRNRGLRDKLASLQLRLEVESRFGRRHQQQTTTGSNSSQHYATSSSASNKDNTSSCRLAPETLAALMAHKKQQRQLEMLQEQLRMQQELLAKHNIAYPTSTSHINIPSSTSHNTFSTPFASSRRHSTLPTTQQHGFHHLYGATNAPSLNIPADEEFNTEHKRREQLLSCHRHYKPSRSTSLTWSFLSICLIPPPTLLPVIFIIRNHSLSAILLMLLLSFPIFDYLCCTLCFSKQKDVITQVCALSFLPKHHHHPSVWII